MAAFKAATLPLSFCRLTAITQPAIQNSKYSPSLPARIIINNIMQSRLANAYIMPTNPPGHTDQAVNLTFTDRYS